MTHRKITQSLWPSLQHCYFWGWMQEQLGVGERGRYTTSHTNLRIPILQRFLSCVKDGHNPPLHKACNSHSPFPRSNTDYNDNSLERWRANFSFKKKKKKEKVKKRNKQIRTDSEGQLILPVSAPWCTAGKFFLRSNLHFSCCFCLLVCLTIDCSSLFANREILTALPSWPLGSANGAVLKSMVKMSVPEKGHWAWLHKKALDRTSQARQPCHMCVNVDATVTTASIY